MDKKPSTSSAAAAHFDELVQSISDQEDISSDVGSFAWEETKLWAKRHSISLFELFENDEEHREFVAEAVSAAIQAAWQRFLGVSEEIEKPMPILAANFSF